MRTTNGQTATLGIGYRVLYGTHDPVGTASRLPPEADDVCRLDPISDGITVFSSIGWTGKRGPLRNGALVPLVPSVGRNCGLVSADKLGHLRAVNADIILHL